MQAKTISFVPGSMETTYRLIASLRAIAEDLRRTAESSRNTILKSRQLLNRPVPRAFSSTDSSERSGS